MISKQFSDFKYILEKINYARERESVSVGGRHSETPPSRIPTLMKRPHLLSALESVLVGSEGLNASACEYLDIPPFCLFATKSLPPWTVNLALSIFPRRWLGMGCSETAMLVGMFKQDHTVVICVCLEMPALSEHGYALQIFTHFFELTSCVISCFQQGKT